MIEQLSEIYFETYGCTANQNSSEIMKGIIKSAGLNITNNLDLAELIIINSCIVKEATQEKIRRRIQDLLENTDKKIILAGCMPRLFARIDPESNMQNSERGVEYYLSKDLSPEYLGTRLFFLDTSQVKNIRELIKDIQDKIYSPDRYLKHRNETKLNLPKIPVRKFVGITQISEGCLGECSYCIVRLAKGKLFSYAKEEILASIKNDLQAGCKEIWITSQDNASYGNDDGKYLLPELLKEILNFKERFHLRLGMMNPNNVLPILDELIEIYKHPKMFKFLHIPIQSGSNKVLKEMNRKYSREDILKIVTKFKKEIPEITIATDIIVGYPTETSADWNQTIDLIQQIKPEILNRSNFSLHKKTPAEKLKSISSEIINRRANEIMKLHLEICKQKQENYLGKELSIIVDEKGFENTWLGRTENYKLVAVQSREKILGKKVSVKIQKVSPHYLIGNLI